jgi:hypothetical protein
VDGSRVFFTTIAPLTGEVEPGVVEAAANNLYMATIGCPGTVPSDPQSCEASQREVTSLVRVSRPRLAGGPAEMQGVVSVAADGSRVYFVAHGVLGEAPNAQGQSPIRGADNLYVYNSGSHSVAFVADLCSGPARSGAQEDPHCPHGLQEGLADASMLWRNSGPEAQSTRSGAFLVFASYGRLLPGDTDDAKDLYRYDAETGGLERISTGEAGYHANGNDSTFSADIGPFGLAAENLHSNMGRGAISEDGSRIVFSTAEQLSPKAHNTGRLNVYEWHEGSVSLVSTGTAEEDDVQPSITPSGNDIFFDTSQGLVPQDTDGLRDVYDARLNGGFPEAPTAPQRCEGEACYGPLTNPAPLLVPGSVSQAPGETLAAPVEKRAVSVKKAKPKKRKHRGRRRTKRRGASSRHTGRAFQASGRSGR